MKVTEKQSWETEQDSVLIISFEHLNPILPEATVTLG